MPSTTVPRGYPYPLGNDPINVAGDIQALAEAIDDDVASIASLVGIGIPIGTVLISALVTEPTGFLFCRGQALPRLGTYADLFAAIGTRYGAGNGSSTFNLPDMQASLPVGFNTKVGQPAGVGNQFGSVFGERAGTPQSRLIQHQHAGVDHLHGINQYVSTELQNHNHNHALGEYYRYNPFVPQGYHAGGVPGNGAPYDIPNSATIATSIELQPHNHAMNAATDPADRNLNTGYTGEPMPAPENDASNYPPSVTFNFIIKAVI